MTTNPKHFPNCSSSFSSPKGDESTKLASFSIVNLVCPLSHGIITEACIPLECIERHHWQCVSMVPLKNYWEISTKQRTCYECPICKDVLSSTDIYTREDVDS